jgi:hypothetical protein
VRIEPRYLTLRGTTRKIVRDKVTITNWRETAQEFLLVPGEGWFDATPRRGVLSPGEQIDITIRARCGSSPSDETASLNVMDADAPWVHLSTQRPEVRLICMGSGR